MAAPLDLPLPPDVACKVRVHTIVLDQQVLPPDEYSINDFLGAGFKLPKLSEGFRGFRWIHVPVNNLAWVEVSSERPTSRTYVPSRAQK